MVDNAIYDEIFTKEELSSAKDNFFSILGQLYNGEALQTIISEHEREIQKEYKVTLPKGYDDFKTKRTIKNNSAFSLILNVFINLLISLNKKYDEDEDIYLLKIAIIAMTCLNGCITDSRNFNLSDITFDKKYIIENKNKITEENDRRIKKIIEYFPLANNFIAFSTLNYVRFNHHYPAEKVHLIRKALLSFNTKLVNEMIEEEELETFYNCLVTPVRICNELLFYERIINKKFENLHETNFRYYNILGTISSEMKEDMITIRSTCTPNGFLVLDLIKAMLEDLKAKNMIFLLPNTDIFSKLMKLRNYIRENAFGYHNSKIFHNCMAKDYDEVKNKFLTYMSIIGGFIYTYTENMEDSIIQAKCRMKYKNKVILSDEKLVKVIFAVANSFNKVDEKDVNILKEKLNKNEVKIDDNLDIEAENKKVLEILDENNDKNNF